MRKLYPIVLRKFNMLAFRTDRTLAWDEYFHEPYPREDHLYIEDDKFTLKVWFDSFNLYYQIYKIAYNAISEDPIIEDDTSYSNEEEALEWLFDRLEIFGQRHDNFVFSIPYSLGVFFSIEYGAYSPRSIARAFVNNYARKGNNLKILMETSAIQKLNMEYDTPYNTMAKEYLLNAPYLSEILVDLFKNKETYFQNILLKNANEVEY